MKCHVLETLIETMSVGLVFIPGQEYERGNLCSISLCQERDLPMIPSALRYMYPLLLYCSSLPSPGIEPVHKQHFTFV